MTMCFRDDEEILEFLGRLQEKGIIKDIIPKHYSGHGLKTAVRCIDNMGNPCDMRKVRKEYEDWKMTKEDG